MTAVHRTVAALLAAGLLGAVAPTARAVDQDKVNAAINKGGEFLKRVYSRPLSQPPGNGFGQVALSGMAMLEAGVPADDPAMQVVTQYIRSNAVSQTGTYHISLAVLFLDRLGDPRDGPVIQFLGVRLLSGLTNAGWGYGCGNAPGDAAQWSAALQQQILTGGKPKESKPDPKKPDSGFPTVPDGQRSTQTRSTKLHPEVARYLASVKAVGVGRATPAGTDNSNTQFGLIGLWVASRHGLPLDDAFAVIEAHFLLSQNKADSGWGYMASDSGSTGAMTCAGLLGLAVGAARKGKSEAPADAKKPRSGNPFDNPTKSSDGSAATGPKPAIPGATVEHRKAAIDGALTTLGRMIQGTSPNGRGGEGALGNYVGHGDMYYLCWSVERVAVAFGIDTIGDQDWYAWGCGYLLPSQAQDGSFANGRYGAEVATAFAILFLSKSNYVADLTKRLGGAVRDPQSRTLRGGGTNTPLLAPKRNIDDDGRPAGSTIPDSVGPNPENAKPIAGLTGEPLADGLIAANSEQWPVRLKLAKDTKGSEYTAALVRAIPRLDVDRRQQAREALSERLTRMTANTLRAMLKEQDHELRRAACLAAAMKEDKSHIPDLIERIVDQSDLVVRAARAGLRSLTGQDFGPPGGADEAARRKAQNDWNRWYLTSGK